MNHFRPSIALRSFSKFVGQKLLSATVMGSLLMIGPVRAEEAPLWINKGTVVNETVLFQKGTSGEGRASLSRTPKKIISAAAADGSEEYETSLFRIEEGGVIADASIRGYSEDELYPQEGFPQTARKHQEQGRLILYGERVTFHSKQTNLTYETDESWTGPVPASQASQLPRFTSLLEKKQPIQIVLLGDSISAGANSSAATRVAPHRPSFGDRLIQKLRLASGAQVSLTNLAVGGKNAQWGTEQVDAVLAKQPDLLIIAFGMNDASARVTAEDFREAITTIVKRVRAASEKTEFVLVSGMTPNPEWDSAETEKRVQLHLALQQVAKAEGCAFADVYSVWNYLVSQKGFLAMAGNGLNHPNDFGHRIYADVLEATILKESPALPIKDDSEKSPQ